MIRNQFKKSLKLIFLPATLLSVLLSCSSTLFYLAQNSLIGTQINPSQLMALKMPVTLSQIILALALLIVSKYRPFEKAFKDILIILIGVISLLTGLMFFQGHLQLQGVLHMYEPLISNWTVSLFYIVSGLLSFNLFFLLIWGFINRLTTISEGIKYYIPLTFVLGLVAALITNLSLLWMDLNDWPLMAMVIPAIAFMICALITFNWTWKRLPEDLILSKEPSANSQTRFPFLSGAYLLAGSLMVMNLLGILSKPQFKMQLPDPLDYSEFIARYAMTASLSAIVVSILWLVLGTCLLLKKGWRVTAICGSLSILIGGLIFLSLTTVSEAVSWLDQGIYNGVLIGTTSTLFFPLIQIFYLRLPYQTRFRTKVITEMIALPLMKGIPSLIIPGLLVFGPLGDISLYLKISVLIFMVLLVLASRRMGSKFPTTG